MDAVLGLADDAISGSKTVVVFTDNVNLMAKNTVPMEKNWWGILVIYSYDRAYHTKE